MSALPEYVEFGLGSSYPGPFECRDGDMRMLVLEGDGARIEELVDRTLNEPARGKVEYRPLGSRVILLYGLNIVSSTTSPWDGYGRVEELLAAFWVPVWAGHSEGGKFHAERLCMSVPHILVDNPISHLAGREIYGFPKALGQFELSGDSLLIKGYGGEFDPKVSARWLPLIEIAPVGDAGAEAEPGPEVEGTEVLVDELAAELIEGYGGERIDLPENVKIAAGLCEKIRSGVMAQVFLKQFRDAGQQDHACYQAVIEAPAHTLRVKRRVSLRDWQVTIHPLDSHPITKELGIETQRAGWSATLEGFDFDVLQGSVVGP